LYGEGENKVHNAEPDITFGVSKCTRTTICCFDISGESNPVQDGFQRVDTVKVYVSKPFSIHA
jgi:translation elongation factor EF-1beta